MRQPKGRYGLRGPTCGHPRLGGILVIDRIRGHEHSGAEGGESIDASTSSQ